MFSDLSYLAKNSGKSESVRRAAEGALCIGGSRGRARRTPPYGTQFFRFRIHFHRKVPMSVVHAPPNGCTPPYRKSWIRHCLWVIEGKGEQQRIPLGKGLECGTHEDIITNNCLQ